jgi:hypothetical protein
VFWSVETLESLHRALIVRGYAKAEGAAKGLPFQAQTIITLSRDGVATPYGLLNASGHPLTRDDRGQIEQIIRASGATSVLAKRHGQWVERTK